MRKITFFLLALICSVTMWAETFSPVAGQAYVIKNVATGGYLNIGITAENEVSLQTTIEKLYFQEVSAGAYKISQSPEGGKYINASAWYATPKDNTETTWTIEESGDGYRLKASTGYLAPDGTAAPCALWSDKGSSHERGVYVIEAYDPKGDLLTVISSALAKSGTNPGYLDADVVTPLVASAQAVYDDPASTDADYESAKKTLNDEIAKLSIIMPVAGKTYQIVSANAAFETQQGVKKAIYADNGQLAWKTISNVDQTMFWQFTPVEGGYAMVNLGTEVYPGVVSAQSGAYPTTAEATVTTLTAIGSGQFNIKTVGSDYDMHTSGHSNGAGKNGTIVGWNAGLGTGSAWYIVEAAPQTSANITYTTADGKFNQTIEVAIGSAYPTPDAPNPFVVFSGVPEGTVSADQTITLTYTSKYDIAADAASITQWYTLDMFGQLLPLWSDGEYLRISYPAVDASVYQNGTADLKYVWGFVGTGALDPIKVYNKEYGKYLRQETDSADEKITLSDEGTAFTIYNTNAGVANSFALKVADRTNYVNRRQDYVQGWSNAGDGSSIRAYAIATITDGVAAEFAALKETQKFDLVEGAKVISPSEYAEPSKINDAIDAAQSVDEGSREAMKAFINGEDGQKIAAFKSASASYGTPLSYTYTTKATYGTIILPINWSIPENWTVYTGEINGDYLTLTQAGSAAKNTPYVIKTIASSEETYQFIGYSNGAATENKTSGALTGVLKEGGIEITDGYIMQKQGDIVGFYKVNGEPKAVPFGKCYIAVAAEVKSFIIGDDEIVTGMSLTPALTEEGTIYNLAGQRVSKMQKGINIVNGKKILK